MVSSVPYPTGVLRKGRLARVRSASPRRGRGGGKGPSKWKGNGRGEDGASIAPLHHMAQEQGEFDGGVVGTQSTYSCSKQKNEE